MPRWIWLLLFALVAALWLASHPRTSPARVAAGTEVPCPPPMPLVDVNKPMQTEVGGALLPFRMGSATVSPLAGLSVQARVLGRENYSFDKESRFSPADLALGWGPMSAPGLAEKLQVTQGSRWYRYQWGSEGPPMAPDDIALNSSNMHMVPANKAVARALAGIAKDDTVRVDGWLIRIDGDDGGDWQSSLSRADRGRGACELVLLCSIQKR